MHYHSLVIPLSPVCLSLIFQRQKRQHICSRFQAAGCRWSPLSCLQLWLKQLRTKPGDSIYDSKQKEGAARASVTWCNDFHRQDTYGDRNSLSSACFDVDQCAAAADAAAAAAPPNSTPPKYALLLTNTLQHEPKSHRFRPEHFWSFTAWQARGVDTVLFIPRCPESATYVICGMPACLPA